MRATAWHNGGPTDTAGGYGIKFTPADRDRAFDRSWSDVVLDLDGAGSVRVELTPSFWRKCSELRSAKIGAWLLAQGAAPWPKSNPPGIAINRISDNRFSARVIITRAVL